MVQENRTGIDCACVIHGDVYKWDYVETLYNMVQRNMQSEVRFHVYTEQSRPVPGHMIKHVLKEWPKLSGPKLGWWYKLQLFDATQHSGNLLYFDLDTVIVDDITWITQLPTTKFWTLRDFRYLQNPDHDAMNSSVMWWNVCKYDWVWREFEAMDKTHLGVVYPGGDQQYLYKKLGFNEIKFLDIARVKSWRWQAWDGGLDFKTRTQNTPGTGTKIDNDTSILVFHGQPKPHEMQDDVVIKQHWK